MTALKIVPFISLAWHLKNKTLLSNHYIFTLINKRPQENISKNMTAILKSQNQKMLRNKNFRRYLRECSGNYYINKI